MPPSPVSWRSARGYSNLEYDLGAGARGSRQSHVAGALCDLTGAEAALVVNNNAAAVLLALAALADRARRASSRVGSSSRSATASAFPTSSLRSGARLVEVGTTNRTRLADYERAIREETAVLLRVHQSNFRIVGFSEQTPARGARAARRAPRPGARRRPRLGSARRARDEPSPRDSLAAGAHLVCFSGDKLLGGPQAGIVVGRADLVERLRRHPLQRALRADKLTLAALEGTLALYRDPVRARAAIPVLRMLDAIRARPFGPAPSASPSDPAGGAVEETVARVGGGALPLAEIASFACALEEELGALLRAGEPPVVGIVRDGRLLLDCRTLTDDGGRGGRSGRRGSARVSRSARPRHRRPHRPRQDVARARADRQGHRPAPGGAGARDLDRSRLRPARAAGRPPAVGGRRSGTRALRAQHGRRSDGDRPLPARRSTRPRARDRRRTSTWRSCACSGSSTASSRSRRSTRSTRRRACSRSRRPASSCPGGACRRDERAHRRGARRARGGTRRGAARVERRPLLAATRLFVDRAFSLRGIGTVVTGTLWSGSIGEGDALVVEPGGQEVRIRSVQVHDRPVARAEAGQRVAASLPGVEREEIARGDALVAPGAFPVSYRLDIAARGARAPAGAVERPRPPRDGRALRTARPGRRALRAAPTRDARRRRARRSGRHPRADDDRRRNGARSRSAAQAERGAPPAARAGGARRDRQGGARGGGGAASPGGSLAARPARTCRPRRGARREPELGDWYMTEEWLAGERARIASALAARAVRLPARPRCSARRAPAAAPLGAGRHCPVAPGAAWLRGVRARNEPDARRTFCRRRGLRDGARRPPASIPSSLPTASSPASSSERGGSSAWATARRSACPPTPRPGVSSSSECESAGRITLARFRDLAGVSRKSAQLLLERLDSDGVTRRVGDERVLRKRGRGSA